MPIKDIEARKTYSAAKYMERREIILAQQKEYAGRNAERISGRQRAYREKNTAKLKAYEEARKEQKRIKSQGLYKDPEHREKVLKRGRKWKARNKEWCVRNKQEWDEANREWAKEYGAKYRADHPDEIATRFKEWRIKNAERMRSHANRRRAIKNGSDGQFTAKEISDLWAKQNGLCVYFSTCGNELTPKGFRGTHRDHIEPLIPADSSRPAGGNTISNIQLLCRSCNQKKKNKDPYLFTQQHEGRLFPDLPKARREKKK